MKEKRRGFTLIELLATIVILAVIALIATPIVLNLINTARKGAARESVRNYVKAINLKIVSSLVDGQTYEDRNDYIYDEIKVEVDGTIPTSGVYAVKNGKVTTGTFCIENMEATYNNGNVQIGKNCKEENLKLSGSVKLSKNAGVLSYPATDTFEVIENISGGELTCTSSDEEVATCKVTDNVVTVETKSKEGVATITIISKETSKYKEAKAVYVVTTNKGIISYTANGYNGIYDGTPHGITVVSTNGIIKYGTEEGVYTLDQSPKYINAGTYIVYYSIENNGYKTVTGSKEIIISKANGSIKLKDTNVKIGYNEILKIDIEENKSLGEIEVSSSDKVSSEIKNNQLIIKGLQVGEETLTITSKETTNYKEATTNVSVTIGKANNTLTLSSNTGTVTYPNSTTFEVIKNVSGGILSCTSSNESVAKCSISGTTVTVTPGTTKGSATLTIKASETSNYNALQVSYVVTTEEGLLSYTANDYTGVYDGASHGITVTSSGSTISYSSDGQTYTSEKPTYINAGIYTTYFKIEKVGYKVINGSKTVTINKANGSIVAPTPRTLTYTGLAQELINAGSTSTGTIEYKLDNGTYSTNIPTAINVGTYKVYYKVVGDNNHNDIAEASISVTIEKGTNTLTLSSNTGEITYPNSTTFEITKNVSGGTLSCTSNNESIAKCSISGTTVTVTPGTTKGNATLTIKSAATTNYKEATVTYTITTKLGILSVTANDYTGVYDGAPHGITVTSSGATISYGIAAGIYIVTSSPTITDVGTMTVYYKVSKPGYTTVTGSKKITINKANGTISLSSTSGTIYSGKTTTVTATSTGPISCLSSNTNVATCTVSDKTITINGISAGNTTITITSAATTNYTSISQTYSVTIQDTLVSKIKLGDYIKMTPTSTSFTTDPSKTGYTSSQTINPSELNIWRVIRINNDGTIEMVSENVSSVDVYFNGREGYKNFIGYLNEIAKAYTNTKYVKSTRHMGYNGQTEYLTDTANTVDSTSTIALWTCSTGGNCNPTESKGGGDTLYETDTNLVETALGTLLANKAGTTSASTYWLSSRCFGYRDSTFWGYFGRSIYTDGRLSGYYFLRYEKKFSVIGYNYAVRPILTLKSGLQATGTGTSSDPYVLE